MRHPDKRTWIIMLPTSIGETALVCSFAEAFVKKHGYGITLVVKPEHFALTQMYPGRFEQVIVMELDEMAQAMRYFPPHQFEVDVPFAASCCHLGDARIDSICYLMKFPGRGGLNYLDMFRHLLMLPWDARIERPKVPADWLVKAQNYAKEIGLVPNKSIILFPATSSDPRKCPDILWNTLVARLKTKGYKIFCNMTGGIHKPQTMPIEGTTPIEVSMEMALPLVSLAGGSVCTGHGMQFLITLGGQFQRMTSFFPLTGNSKDYEQDGHLYASTMTQSQLMAPEMYLNIPYMEYGISTEASDEEIERIAIAAADQSALDPNCYRHFSAPGVLYVDAHADWLSKLIEPIKRQ
ncbi:hypothetical protein RGU70_01685 [Herbaspirillum sp. RTI4]|uniref:hypothetical protein n=1 Tax=Herbaspirillum sp. RTI4 TaxID=3048640 RepID=UPI002AB3D512|nr:hypothetical protein [Herbaspirillum sp. RTI4]MDY7577037.1 hypothetical protein [Herbaspirillum sp. RTI4]MEA9983108.1 hypothetical protein [Herbaspirillum sp. RTI4]